MSSKTFFFREGAEWKDTLYHTLWQENYQKIQLKSDETAQLLNKPYVNDVTLTGQNSPTK